MMADGSESADLRLRQRALFVWFGVVSPLFCFAFSHVFHRHGSMLADLEFKTFGSCLLLMLSNQAVVYFSPVLGYAMIGMVGALVWKRSHRWFVCRLGIYTGVLLSIQFAVSLSHFGTPSLLLIACGGVIILWRRRLGRIAVLCILVNLLGLGIWYFCRAPLWSVFGETSLPTIDDVLNIPRESLLLLLIFLYGSTAPGLSFLAYLKLSVHARRSAPAADLSLKQSRTYALIGWAVAYAAAMALAVRRIIPLYDALPEHPDCYVSTAAASGHRWLVRSHPVRDVDGRIILVNDQMRRLKCAELTLLAVAPGLHRWCRRIYDTVGPPLAGRITCSLLADLAYLSLKPAEWAARIGLLLVPRDVTREMRHRLAYLTKGDPTVVDVGETSRGNEQSQRRDSKCARATLRSRCTRSTPGQTGHSTKARS
jgi:hypothetical protein